MVLIDSNNLFQERLGWVLNPTLASCADGNPSKQMLNLLYFVTLECVSSMSEQGSSDNGQNHGQTYCLHLLKLPGAFRDMISNQMVFILQI